MDYLQEIDTLIEAKHLLKTPFYQAWTRGELSREVLRDYALQYYQHVKAFPRYLSALHSRTEDKSTRKKILENLVEEEGGDPDHPDLWKAFACRLGASSKEADDAMPRFAMQKMIATFATACKEKGVAEGLAALYAYESQIPAVSESKIAGLKCHYQCSDPKDWEYFSVHIEADKEHAAVERELLSHYVNAENWKSVKDTVEDVLDSLNGFLASLCDEHQLA